MNDKMFFITYEWKMLSHLALPSIVWNLLSLRNPGNNIALPPGPQCSWTPSPYNWTH